MRILVMSDSHSGLSIMRRAVESVKPDAIIHLGDYYDDGQVIAEEYPHILMHQVPGNCDRYRCPSYVSDILSMPVCGVKLYMTHGHKHQVKQTLSFLLKDARAGRAQAVLYGHTHQADCHQEEDGLWVLNPGSCGYYGGSVGIIEVEDKKIQNCWILRHENMEAIK